MKFVFIKIIIQIVAFKYHKDKAFNKEVSDKGCLLLKGEENSIIYF